MPNGEVLHRGGKTVKNSSGYSLKDLLIGAEGTLGIITEATLRLLPLPSESMSLLVPFDSMDAALKTVPAIIISQTEPTAIEYMSRETILLSLIHISHIPREELLADAAAVAARHDVFDCRYVGLGCFPLDEEKDGCRYADFLEQYRPVAKTLREHGKYFMYHNHDAEFRRVGNTVYLEKMAEDFSPTEMGFTLDTFWVQAGGGDPAAWLSRLSRCV